MACAAHHACAGPEWRATVYDEERDILQEPVDDGARHRLWVSHTLRGRAQHTRVGAAFDLGRLVNYVADFVDYRVSRCELRGRICGLLGDPLRFSGG